MLQDFESFIARGSTFAKAARISNLHQHIPTPTTHIPTHSKWPSHPEEDVAAVTVVVAAVACAVAVAVETEVAVVVDVVCFLRCWVELFAAILTSIRRLR